jgi:SAM-dependent methyltransferase
MNATNSGDRLRAFLRFAACPACRGALHHQGEALRCQGCGRSYPLLTGRPVFLDDPGTVKVMPAGHESNQPPSHVVEWLRNLDGWALNVGAGGTVEKIPNVIELEYSLFRHTDVSADAHHLPFRDGVFDAVVTFNTFEHLHNPFQAAREIHRVLKPGGRLFLHTAFLQPLHEAPHHYYNATEFGVRRWFTSFDITDVRVSDNFNPAYVLAWFCCEVLAAVEHHVGPEARGRLAASSLESWAACWSDPSRRDGPLWDALRRLPTEVQKRFAAGFELDAVKPLDAPAAKKRSKPLWKRFKPARWLERMAKSRLGAILSKT